MKDESKFEMELFRIAGKNKRNKEYRNNLGNINKTWSTPHTQIAY